MTAALLHDWLDPLLAQQDYLWFVAALAWLLALGQGRSERRPPAWLVVVGLAQIGGALCSIAHFVTVPSDLIRPHRGWEWAAWMMAAAQTTALAGALHRLAPLAAGPAAFGFAVWQMRPPLVPGQDLPTLPGLTLALAAGIIAAGVAFRQRRKPTALLALAVAGTVACCPHGGLAELATEARRWSVLTPFALSAAGCTFLSALAARAVSKGTGLRTAWLGGDLRSSTLRLTAWLGLGLVLALFAGYLARHSFEEGILARGRAYASVSIDLPALERWLRDELTLGPSFVARGYARRPVTLIRAPATESATIAPLRRLLRAASPSGGDVRYAHVTTLRDGRLIIAVFPKSERDPAGIVGLQGDATPDDHAAWAEHRSYIAPLSTGPRGTLVQVRTALVSPEARMLGWLSLDVVAARWFAVQGQARLQVLAFVALGVALLLLVKKHQLRLEEKAAAERAAAHAAASDAAKNAFLAQVSHELRTPVQSVLGFGELLAASDLNDRQRVWLRAQRSHGDLLLRLVNDLLDTLSLQQGSFRLNPRPGNLREVVHEAIETWRPRAEAKGLELSVTLRAESGVTPTFDGPRVRQVIHNLVGNAIKFTPAGSVRIVLEIGPRRSDSIACSLLVSDSGPGIPEADLGALFTPFGRLAATRHAEGAGLGLAISRHLCRAMGGDLVFLPATSPGASFLATWHFPVASMIAPTLPPAPPGDIRPLLAGLRVLVADDNAFVRHLLAEGLLAYGATVETARDGAEALVKARHAEFDALVLDLSMPAIEGDEVARRLRQSGSRLRIVGVSAHATVADRDRAFSAGIDAFLPKPASLAALCASLRPTLSEQTGEPEDSPRLSAMRHRLREEFLAGSPLELAQLEPYWRRRDWVELARGAHRLKGSADMLGLPAFSNACAELYSAAIAGDVAIAGAAFNRVADLLRNRPRS